ncbi:unnamed protein product [Psylliodes chrysocephalus]|uniref:Luciferin 4-monooxygenase n=1 Tax=Psylliodes chrysocephalus TaxID=3402493 RepID=A0A9P0CYA1_9CUCU|nr:unnamed protein product [Psylliodes chrysocephala]
MSLSSREDGLGELLFKCLQKYDKRVLQFLDDTNDVNTFSDILTRSVRTAIKLKQDGISRGDIVSSCTHSHKNSIIPFIATQFLGAISTTFDENLPPLDTVHLLKLVQPKILFVSENSLEFIEKCLHKANINTKLVVFGASKEYTEFSKYVEPCHEEEQFYPVQIENQKDVAVIVFSSGTTGLPKGICLHHTPLKNVTNLIFNKSDTYNEEKNVLLLYASLYWNSGINALIKAITNGCSLVTCKRYDPAHSWKLIEKYKVTFMFLPSYDAKDFLHHKPKNVDTSSLKIFLTGACAVSEKLMEGLIEALPHTRIIQNYGSTETITATLFNPMNDEEYKMQLLKPTSCGKMVSNFKWKVVDINSEKLLGPNEQGEIRVKGEYMTTGYYKMDYSAAFDLDGYLKTGDLAYYDEDECFYIVGRIKEIFKYRGWHIIPAIIVEVLTSHPAVREAAIVGVPHEIDLAHPMGVVVLNKGYDHINTATIVNFVNERVSESQKLRAGVIIVDNIPKTITGKIKSRFLKEIVSNNYIQ